MKKLLRDGKSHGVSGQLAYKQTRTVIAVVMTVVVGIVMVNTITYGDDSRPNESTMFENSQTMEIL